MSCKYVAIKETNKLNLKRRILKTQFLRCKMPLLLIIGWKMGPNIYLPSVHSSQVSMRYSYTNAFIIHTKKEMIFIIDFEWYWITIFVAISVSPSNMIWPWAVRIFFQKPIQFTLVRLQAQRERITFIVIFTKVILT